MTDNNKTKTNDVIREIENPETFLNNLLKSLKPKTDAVTEKQKKERFVKAILDLGKTDRK